MIIQWVYSNVLYGVLKWWCLFIKGLFEECNIFHLHFRTIISTHSNIFSSTELLFGAKFPVIFVSKLWQLKFSHSSFLMKNKLTSRRNVSKIMAKRGEQLFYRNQKFGELCSTMKERVVWQYIEQLLLLSWWFQWKTLCYIFFTHQFFMKELCFYFDRCSNQANKNVDEPKGSSTVSKDKKTGIAKNRGAGGGEVEWMSFFKTMKDTL